MKRISPFIPDEVHKWLAATAKSTNTTVNALARHIILREYTKSTMHLVKGGRKPSKDPGDVVA